MTTPLPAPPQPPRPSFPGRLWLVLLGLGVATATGFGMGGLQGCTPPDVPPALGATLMAPAAAEEALVVQSPSPGLLDPHLSRPAPDSAMVRQALDSLERALDDWREATSPEDAGAAAWRADRSLAALPTMDDWRPLIRAELMTGARDTAQVRLALEEVEPDSGFMERWGWRFVVESLDEARDPARAREAAEAMALGDVRPSTAAWAWFRAGGLAMALGDTTAALERMDRALSAGPQSQAAQAAARILDRAPRPTSFEQDLELGRALMAAEEWQRAVNRLSPLLEDPEHTEVLLARIRLDVGRALFELRRYAHTREMLAPLQGDAVPTELAAPALYWSGRAALGAGNVSAAETAFLRLARRAPESPLAERGLLLLLNRENLNPPTPRGLELLDELFALGAPGAAGELAVVRIGTGKYLRGEYEQAVVTFARYLEATPRTLGRQQAAYWSAMAHERRGDREGAEELFRQAHRENPLSFYGVFAGERVGAPVLGEDIAPGPEPAPDIENVLANALIRLQVHRLVPTAGSFALELERLSAYFLERGDEAYDFAEAMIGSGFALHGIVLGREIHRREGEWNLRLLRIVHPFPYREAVVEEARSRGLDPFFVAGLIRQESMFDARVRSPAGAVGLMQLMPATARQVARSAGVSYSLEGLEDPRTNIRLGTTFLASLVNRFDGRAEDALSAYNAGPTRLQRWRRTPEYGDRDVFMEHIPFAETRNYVKLVQQYARIYTALYGCGEFEACPGETYPAVLARSPTAGGAPTTSSVAR